MLKLKTTPHHLTWIRTFCKSSLAPRISKMSCGNFFGSLLSVLADICSVVEVVTGQLSYPDDWWEITSEAGSSSSLPEATVLVVELSKRNVFSVERSVTFINAFFYLAFRLKKQDLTLTWPKFENSIGVVGFFFLLGLVLLEVAAFFADIWVERLRT